MRKLMLSLAAGFSVTLILIFAFAHADGLHLFRDQAVQAGRAAFSDIFPMGNSEHMTMEIALTKDSSSSLDIQTGSPDLTDAPVSAKNISPKAAKISDLKSETNPAHKSNAAEKIAAIPPAASSEDIAAIKVSEIMAGASSNPSDEFIKLVNIGNTAVNMSGWSIKKETASGAESTLVSANRFAGKIILPHGYFLLANSCGWSGFLSADISWPASYSLSYTSNSITLYAQNNILADSVSWSEIPAGKSYVRDPITEKFSIQNVPTPQASK